MSLKNNRYVRSVAVVFMISALLCSLCACRKEPPVNGSPAITPAVGNAEEKTPNPRQLSSEVPQPIRQVGKSAAFSFEADDIITVSGDENTLFEDTVLTVVPVNEPVRELEEPLQALADSSNYPVGIWKIDGGLEPDEHFPGTYQMAVKLDALGIDRSVYDNLVFYRIDEAGNISEYLYEIQGDKAIIKSSQNSFLVCALLIGLGGTAVLTGPELVKAEDYYYQKGRSREDKDYDADGGSYTIVWSPEDIGYDESSIKKKISKKENKYREQAEAQYKDCTFWERLAVNADIARNVSDALEADKDYQKLAAELETPEIIRLLSEQIDKAFKYLKDVAMVKMPEYRVTFYVRKDISEMGTEITNIYTHSYIQVGLNEISGIVTEADSTGRDNLLLTVTHELFHLCQENYHYKTSKEYNKFDEMVAVVLESDARDYYRLNGQIMTEPKLTDSEYWTVMLVPIDKTDIDAALAIHQGYNLSLFVKALREKTGKNVTAEQLMTAHDYYWDAVISEPLMNAFGISEITFDSIYRSFAVDNRKAAGEYYLKNRAGAEYTQLNTYKLGTEPIHVSLQSGDDYRMGIRGFYQKDDNPCALLLVLDNETAAEHPDSNVAPAEAYSNTAFGAFIPEKVINEKADRYRTVLECYGARGIMRDSKQSGYTIIPVYAPAVPYAVVNEGKILVSRPMDSVGMSEGYIEGYCLTLYLPGEKEGVSIDVPADKFTATYSINIEDYLPERPKGETPISLTIAEYVKSSKGNSVYGPESKKTTVTLEGVEREEAKSGSLRITEDSVYSRLGIEMYKQDTIYDDGVSVVKNADMSLDITVPAAANPHFNGYYSDEYYSFSISGLTFHAEPEKGADFEWEKYKSYSCTADLSGQVMDLTSTHFVKEKKSCKRTGKCKFTDEAKVYYTEEDGKVYLSIYLSGELEMQTLSYASSVPGSTDTVMNRNYNATIHFECGQ